jgi:hypothetical protein
MKTGGPSWEGFFLAFAMIFTVLLGAIYGVAVVFRFAVPWLVILLLSVALAAVLYIWRRRQT